ncbi:hypothetical protein SNOG_03616 [Parastagonospora nodorum SN15]|uniref:Rho-GAP domain-containing protein n=1 Tax=Phaeosphaeria nodorum (strain SN15 / ATCC MYA-4574 / FGSC 10173) TaxID=321614 RepID=Q0UX98_PHANO|nr:hypothetical protein SNOG_03616 [Parastagonospora nodorum SN15]EAT88821.2 hypothetical protein SNOG_03616 [Parastagonospora nodorum SN15]
MPKSTTLSLAMRGKNTKENSSSNTPMSPKSPTSPQHFNSADYASPKAPFRNQPESPASPKLRKDSKNIFSHFSANKSSSRLVNPQDASMHSSRNQPSPVYSNGRGGTSTPDLGRPVQTPNSDGRRTGTDGQSSKLISADNRSEIVHLDHRTGSAMSNDTAERADSSKRNTIKPKKQGMLSRSRSQKGEEGSGTRSKLNKAPPPQLSPDVAATWTTNGDTSLKTAPLEKNQSWRSLVGQNKMRTHSADGHEGNHREEEQGARRLERAEQSSQASGSYNDNRGANLMSSIGFGARKVGGKMDSARKGIFGKLGRSSSNHETPTLVTNEPYVCKVIHKPLIEQTRLTRISSRLEQSRDKTEFWMPALPWRCIDYLNMRGCEEEGLYRVPGSAQQVRYYERKFDTDGDIDLISDPNLNDPNVIGSLFKGWLRQLPDEIFPKEIQARIQRECQGSKTTPQMLKDELSKLPPFNYYLLFAITCHISLLHSCSEFNKMNYNNLCICFQPAIKIDAFCFQFLILDWRNCWQGCWTEKDYLGEELDYLQSLEEQAHQSVPNPDRNGQQQTVGKSKHSLPSPHIGHGKKAASTRSGSVERTKVSARDVSTDRNGRAASPGVKFTVSESPREMAQRPQHLERDSSTERTVSSSDSREAYSSARGTPKRTPQSVSTRPSIDDDASTPTQANQHSRGPSDTQFRLDLNNPPSSPFNIKF